MQNKLFGVIGNPIAHSKSPVIHNFWFQKLNINANYEKILLKNSDSLKSTIMHYSGVNITLPYKEKVLDIVDIISTEVSIVKAANTIINTSSGLKAYNTDIFGFFEPIKNEVLNNALIIGAGGAARAVYYALHTHGIKTVVVNRSKKEDFLCEVKTDLTEFEFDIIINTTSASLNNILPLNEDNLKLLSQNAKIAYDLAYNHNIFLDFCKLHNKNIKIQDGLDMLVYQAALAFKYFCGIYPSEELINGAKKLII